MRIWRFCGGYRPDLWPVADVFAGPVANWRICADLQLAIKEQTR